MTAHATKENLTDTLLPNNLFLPIPDTDFYDFLCQVEELADYAPQIVEEIEKDLDKNAREKKWLRQADRKFYESQTSDFPLLDFEEQEVLAEALELATGRPRMSGYTVYIFLMIRGFLGSLSSKPARRLLNESITLYDLLQRQKIDMPGITTIVENVNLVSHATRRLIFDKQIEYVLKEDLDDFTRLTIDSTSVKANSCWPTDSTILTGLLGRAYRLGQKLHAFGLDDFRKGWCPRWIDEMDKLVFQICLVSGKANSKGKLKKKYRQLLKRGGKTTDFITKELNCLEQNLSIETFPPSRRILLQRILSQIRNDLDDAKRVLDYASDRVFRNKTLPSQEKVLSLSDGSAAYIKKGSRNPVIGYKPQLVRSANGFVTTLIVPEGNAADSGKLTEAIQESINRTGVIAELVSTDDGYASANGKSEVLDMGVKAISISGSKGKKLTEAEDWNSETYKDARRDRSAVESLMFTIKDGFAFGELGRRGIDAVRDELLEKVLAYNCCRIILMKKRHREELQWAS
jgi:IS5 family transposase